MGGPDRSVGADSEAPVGMSAEEDNDSDESDWEVRPKCMPVLSPLPKDSVRGAMESKPHALACMHSLKLRMIAS